MGESCGEQCGLRKAVMVDGLAEEGAAFIQCGPQSPPIFGSMALHCPMSSMQFPGELLICLGEESGQLEDNDIGSCLMFTS